MLRWFSMVIILMMGFFPKIVLSLEEVRVVVLPFEIYSQEDLSYLQTEIPGLIKNQLKQDGAIVVESAITRDVSWRDKVARTAGIRNIGIKSGADYVVWGSLTRIGEKFSLDAKMLESFTEAPPTVFFVEGEGIENLIGIVRELARDLGIKLFKQEKIAKVLVTGNKRIEVDAIKRKIKTQAGGIFLAKNLSEDLKSVYAMGYFDDIRIEAEDSPEGKVIIFKVKEKSTIRFIRFQGNKEYKDEEIKESLTIKTGSILNVYQIQNNIQRIEGLYKDKNYHNVKVTYEVQSLENNQADLEFVIEEGEKLRIKKIMFIGNSAFSEKRLKGIMKNSEKGFFSWLTQSGDLNKEDLNQDTAKLTAYYHNRGYIQANVGDPQIEYDGNWIYITIKVEEGSRFRVGKVDISGDIVLTKPELMSKLKITKEEFYNREILRNDVLTLTDLYADEGYAYADFTPQIDRNIKELLVDIVFAAKKGKQVSFEKILISGNTKTRDKVIRRELKVYEQELYSGRRLKRGVRNLYRLNFFEEIKVDTTKGSTDDTMILKIDVKEKPTGSFSFGGGFSSVENLFFVGSINQLNLFGRGQKLELKAEIGGRTNRYTISFTEPWLFDIPLSAGFDLYNWSRDWDTYVKDSIGGGVRFGYPVYDYTRAYLSYNFDRADIRDITSDASKSVKDLEGINVTSSITGRLRYDSRDRVFLPTEGSDHSITVEYAGLGGDIGFTKFVGNTGWFIPLFWDTVGFLHGKGGYIRESSGKTLPDYERFYMGGINTVRGYEWRDISLVDEDGAKIGGEKFIQFNLEYIFPLYKKAGLMGLIFYDTGNVYASDEHIDLGDMFQSVGAGVRWYSPIGPIRLEYGYPLNPEEGQRETGRWEFAMGGAF